MTNQEQYNLLWKKAVDHELKKGHWIASDIPDEKYVCSECGGACWYYDHKGEVAKSRYCPNCGAKMMNYKFNVEVWQQ